MTKPSPQSPPQSPKPSPKRCCDDEFPPYRFIPGINPHPVRDPKGHSYGEPEDQLSFVDPKKWQEIPHYLFGIDLYNHAYWWESHEKWEAVWHTTNKEAAYGQFLQGLIQISAAFIKWHLKQQDGLTRLYEIGIGRLEFVNKSHAEFMGVDLDQHIEKLKKHFSLVTTQKDTWPDALENYPFIELINP